MQGRLAGRCYWLSTRHLSGRECQAQRIGQPASIALVRYREQLVRMRSDQVQWKPYGRELGKLPTFCKARKEMWRAIMPLVCFCIVEIHHPDRVLRQFGLAQGVPVDVVYDTRLHGLADVDRNWWQEHAPHIQRWDNRQHFIHDAPPHTDDMRQDEEYLNWYHPRTRKYVDRNSTNLDMMVMWLNK